MTLQTMRKTLRTLFQSENIESPETDSGLILMHILQINKNQLLLTNPQISEMHQQEIMNLAYRRIQGEPVRYLIGSCPFMDLTFDVNPSVLIPRPDTELLVEAVSKQLSRYPKNSMLWDIGCGSGCIGISLAHMHPSLHVTELDISQKALDTATATACRYHLENRIRFVHHDILSGWPSLPAPAVIVSNPPFYTLSEGFCFCLIRTLHHRTRLFYALIISRSVRKSQCKYYSCKETVTLLHYPTIYFRYCNTYYGSNFQLMLLPYYSKTATEYFTIS